MKFTVAWRSSAQQQLAQLWITSSDRSAVTVAANTIDAALAYDPSSQGESRSGLTRFLYEPPLAILFDVIEPDRMVTVWAVWQWPR